VKDYLTLVNDAISEAKVTLDPLTAANFDNPPRTILYNKFKEWVNRAYKELLIRRNEWHFRTERAVVNIYPRLHLSNITYTPAIGDELESVETGEQFKILEIHSFEDVEQDAITEATFSVELLNNTRIEDLRPLEVIDQTFPASTASVATVKGMGYYDFTALIPEVEKPDMYKMKVWHITDDIKNAAPLIFVPWNDWANQFGLLEWDQGEPLYVTQTPEGSLAFYPHPDQRYVLGFEFTRGPSLMVLPTDTPEAIPERYEDYIMWKAVYEFADYDQNTRLFSRANKHVEEYLYWLERDELPVITFDLSRFDRGPYC
jgi:hypothetical protein